MATPIFSDGKTAPTAQDQIVYDISNGFAYYSDDCSVKELIDSTTVTHPSGRNIGGISEHKGWGGSATMQYDQLDYVDETSAHMVRGCHVLKYRNRYYRIMGDIEVTMKKGSGVTFKVALEGWYNPIISSLLSGVGKCASKTGVVGTAFSLANTVLNTRTGAVITWAISGGPDGMTINASTGAITWTTPVAGTYAVDVTVTDTLAGDAVPVLSDTYVMNLTVAAS